MRRHFCGRGRPVHVLDACRVVRYALEAFSDGHILPIILLATTRRERRARKASSPNRGMATRALRPATFDRAILAALVLSHSGG